jgi:hypothetical protein
MSKDSGYLVKTKTGKEGRTFHREGLVNKKTIVHILDENGKDVKLLCNPKTIKIIGYVD